MKTLAITGPSKLQVSEMAKNLYEQVEQFRTRPLDQAPYTFVAAEALTTRVREGGRVVKVACLVATGINADGYREILGRRHPRRQLTALPHALRGEPDEPDADELVAMGENAAEPGVRPARQGIRQRRVRPGPGRARTQAPEIVRAPRGRPRGGEARPLSPHRLPPRTPKDHDSDTPRPRT